MENVLRMMEVILRQSSKSMGQINRDKRITNP
jgi:hypothetical protein